MTTIQVDEYCNIDGVSVYSTNSGINYSCTLNQTNIEKNNNKFYIIQVLVRNYGINASVFYVYSRYGRVGEKGSISPQKTYNNEREAIKEFQKRFRNKTGNMWSGNISTFRSKPGKYTMMDTIQPDIEVIEEDGETTKLDTRVSGVISLISSKKTMVNTMKKMDVDTSKLPLGKISSSQISSAHSILKKIKSWIHSDRQNILDAGIKDPNHFIRKEISELSSRFWTLIPFACGRSKPPIIETKESLEKYTDLLEVLENIKIAGTLSKRTNNLDDIYGRLEVSIEGLDKNSEEWPILEKYVQNTKAPTHNYQLEIMDIFKVQKEQSNVLDRKNYFDSLPDHRLLIHGSRMVNYMSIFSNGVRIPKPDQVSNGSVLGLGAYFADSISKSFNYSYPGETDGIGFVILCEVALGDNPHVVNEATFDIRPSKEYTSRIALGKTTPDLDDIGKIKTCTEVSVPYGKLVPSNKGKGFRYNEYVIYDSRQYRFRYLIKLKAIGNVSCW